MALGLEGDVHRLEGRDAQKSGDLVKAARELAAADDAYGRARAIARMLL